MEIGAYFSRSELEAHRSALKSPAVREMDDAYVSWSLKALDRLSPPKVPVGLDKVGIPINFCGTTRYLSVLRHIAAEFSFASKTIYVPGHGRDVSHCLAFTDSSRIINLEITPGAVAIMRAFFNHDNRIESHLGMAQTFRPYQPVDVIVALSSGYKLPLQHFKNFLAPHALLIGNYDVFDSMPSIEKLGYFDSSGQLKAKTESKITVQTDREFLESNTIYEDFVRYSEALRSVYRDTGKSDNLVDKYNALRQRNPLLKPLPIRQAPFDELCVYRMSS